MADKFFTVNLYGGGIIIMKYTPETEIFHNLRIINAGAPVSQFEGVNGVYSPFGFFTDCYGRGYTGQQLRTELDRLQKMGVTMVRSYYSPALTWNQKTGRHDYEGERMQEFFRFCLALQERGIEIGLFAGWDLRILINAPEDPEEVPNRSSLTIGYGIAVPGDMEASCKNYSDFIKNSVLAFERHGIRNIKCMFAFTECNNMLIHDSSEGSFWERRNYKKLIPVYHAGIEALDAGLRASGLRERYRIVAPCDNWRNDMGYEPYSILVRHTLAELGDKVDIIGTHNGYDRSEHYTDDWYYIIPQKKLQACCNEIRTAGKACWLDEYNVAVEAWELEPFIKAQADPWKGTALGAMTASVLDMGVSSVFLWALCDQLFTDSMLNNGEFKDGLQTAGYLRSMLETDIPLPAWYACSLITRYFGRGRVYKCTQSSSLYSGCLEREDGEWSILVVNYNRCSAAFQMTMDASLGGKTLYRHLYDPAQVEPTAVAELIGISGKLENVTTEFADSIPAGAVAVYTTRAD